MGRRRLSGWVPLAAVAASLAIAWLNFLLTTKWAALPGALNGWRRPWYAAALLAASALAVTSRQAVGTRVRLGRLVPALVAAGGAGSLAVMFFSRLPLSTWTQIPFQDDWTELYQQTVNSVHLLHRGAVLGWNWWLMGGYPTSTDIAQNFSLLALVPMALTGERVGYHLLHAVMLFSLPILVWWDMSRDDREAGLLAGGLAGLFVAGYAVSLWNSGDTNSLAGVFTATLAIAGSRAAQRGAVWGGPIEAAGLTLAMYSHQAFFVYACIFLAIESLYYADRRALLRLVLAAVVAVLASVPLHWEFYRHPAYVSFNNTVYDPSVPPDWSRFIRLVYYSFEILAFPGRWFNDYRSLCNVWLAAIAVVALGSARSRAGFYAWTVLAAQLLLRFNTPEAGAMFDRLQHMLPVLAAPALTGVVLHLSGTRRLAAALTAVIGLYVATGYAAIPHVRALRDWDRALIDRVARLDGMVAFEINPHRDMDLDPARRTPRTPFGVHFEGLLPDATGLRFYSQMIDGYAWNVWRGQVIGAGTFRGRLIDDTPPAEFAAEMRRWGVRHVVVWTDISRDYLARSGAFLERWRGGRWSDFELTDSDVRSVVSGTGSGRLANLDFLGGDVVLENVSAGAPVTVRTNFYPAWRASVDGRDVPLSSSDGQLSFRAPRSGSYIVRLDYPRYRGLSLFALAAFLTGATALARWPGSGRSTIR